MSQEPEFSISTFPYPGLRPFNHDEADIFFGREKQVTQLLEKLGTSRFLAVVGPSGCGKSSLIRAGLIPYLEAGLMAGTGSRWRMAEMRPGNHPLLALARALLKTEAMGAEWGDDADAAPFLAAELRRGPLALAELMHKKPLPAGTNLLILVDQFEEMFRMEGKLDADEGNKFVDLLLETLKATGTSKDVLIGYDLPVYLILTMRSDFLGDCALFRNLPEAISENLYLTPRLTREQTETAIVGPARVCGGEVDPVLVNRLLNEISPDPDQLPVLQHALMRMWRQMLTKLPAEASGGTASKILTLEHYKGIGETLGSSLDRHAEEVYGGLEKNQKPLAELMFRSLTERALGQRDRRRPARLGEIAEIAAVSCESIAAVAEESRQKVSCESIAAVAEIFRQKDCNFVMPPLTELLAPDTILDIGHESLIRQWVQLNTWVSQEAQSATAYQRLVQQALRWESEEAELWQGLDLERILKWREDNRPSAVWARRYTIPAEDTGNESALAEKADREFALTEEFIKQSKTMQADVLERELRLTQEQRVKQELFDRTTQRSQRLRKLLLVAFSALAIVGGLTFVAFSERNRAQTAFGELDKERRLRFDSELASEVLKLRKTKPDLAALLSLEGERLKFAGKPDSAPPAVLPPKVAFSSGFKAMLHGSHGSGGTVAFSPDHKHLAEGAGNSIAVWDLEHPSLLPKMLTGHSGVVEQIVFAPDGSTLLSAGDDGTIRVWDMLTLKPAFEPLITGNARIFDLTFDGNLIASAHEDGTVALWDFNTRKRIGLLANETEQAWYNQVHVDFRPDKRWLVSGSYDKTARVWDVRNIDQPKLLAKLSHPDKVFDVAFSPDGHWLATLSDTIRLYETTHFSNAKGKNQKPFKEFVQPSKDERPWSITFDPEGKKLAQTNKNGTIRIWDVKDPISPRTLRTLAGHQGEVWQGAFSFDGELYASVGKDETVRLWDLLRRHPLASSIDPPGVPEDRLAVGYGTEGFWVAVQENGTVAVYDEHAKKPIWPLLPLVAGAEVMDQSVRSVVFSGDGSHMALELAKEPKTATEAPSTIAVFDLRSQRDPFLLQVGGKVSLLALNRQGTKLAAVFSEGGHKYIRLWKENENIWTENKSEIMHQELKKQVDLLVFDPVGDIPVTIGQDGIEFRDGTTLQTLRRVPRSANLSWVTEAAFNSSGTLLALREWYTSAIRLIDVKTGEGRNLKVSNCEPGNNMAFSPDGKFLTVLCYSGSIVRWQVEPKSWQIASCAVANRNISCKEWRQYITQRLKDQPFDKDHRTCPNPEFAKPEPCPNEESAEAPSVYDSTDGEDTDE